LARKILLADDSVTAQNMGRKILADAGYDVVTVNNGSAALKRIAEIKPDLIVLDVYMPGYSGLEVCQRLKDAGETAHIPVLLTVGKLEPFKPEEARRVRADAHIVKPFEASELLTAITRLEDRMVPQQAEGSRFGASVSGVERFGGEGGGRKSEINPGADTGWKSRLGFPSKKKKEEPEDVTAAGSFRDFRKGKGKTGAGGAFPVKAAPGQEPGLVSEVPRDITPEELDALSALAAKLDGTTGPTGPNGSIPAAENTAALADRPATAGETDTRSRMGPAEAPSVAVTAANAGAEVFAAEPDAWKKEGKEEKTEAETPAPAVEPAAVAVETPAFAVEGGAQVEIPVEHLELSEEAAAAVADPVAVETHRHETEHPVARHSETQHSETHASVGTVEVNTALLAQEPAPVDRNDEPMFASAASAVEQAAEEKTEAMPAEAVAQFQTTQTTEAGAPADAVAAKDPESQPKQSETQDLKAEELPAENSAQPLPVAANVQAMAAAEEPAPSDEELAQALRLLTPAIGHAEVSTVPSLGSLVAAGPHWVAEPVPLSREEAAISLEAEMFRTFALMPAAAPGGEIEPVRITGVSAIAAAVENRLAAVELAASATAWPEQGAERFSAGRLSDEHGSAEHGSEITSAEISAVEASAAAMAVVSNVASPVVDGIEAGIEAARIAPGKLEAEPEDSPATVPEGATAEEVAAATFADVVGQNQVAQDEVEATAEPNGNGTAAAMAPAVVEGENQESSSNVEGRESMRKDVKSRSGKSNWHQIRTAPPSAATNRDVVETEKAAKAMAAAAAEGSSSSSAPDASTIASIVDSVMADLRPKIVEEIAKRLAGK
jgi:CheY-like chemotaxis protein